MPHDGGKHKAGLAKRCTDDSDDDGGYPATSCYKQKGKEKREEEKHLCAVGHLFSMTFPGLDSCTFSFSHLMKLQFHFMALHISANYF